jgi:hypothetical protein
MIPISTFNLLLVIDILFIIYVVIDHRNRLYANVVFAFVAGLLAAFLGQASISEAVYDVIGGTLTVVSTPSIGYFMGFLSLIMFAYTMFMAYEIIQEQFEAKDNAKREVENSEWE